MNGLRTNIDLFFIDYNKKAKKYFIIPLVMMLLSGIAVALFILKIVPIHLDMLYIYLISSFSVFMFIVTIIVGVTGKDRVRLPTSEHMSALLAEDIAKTRQTAQNLFPPTFEDGVTREIVVVNHCEENILGFRPYIKKVGTTYHCSLNKISIFNFGEKKLQITTQVTDVITGIDVMQNTIVIPYSEISNCYIAYDNNINQSSVKFRTGDLLNKNQRLPKLVSAVKDCKEILRISSSNNTEDNNFDILVAHYQLFYTQDNLYKNVYSLNAGKELEKEILTRIGVLKREPDKKIIKIGKEYNFIDSVKNMKKNATFLN